MQIIKVWGSKWMVICFHFPIFIKLEQGEVNNPQELECSWLKEMNSSFREDFQGLQSKLPQEQAHFLCVASTHQYQVSRFCIKSS
uniref:Secreted protein n=1 Tax=Ixodes ricinus TaxID=34613 RepID=A0A6B0TY35_IXORI